MTARQPPREKGAKACTIGCDSSRDGDFCAYFSGGLTEKESNDYEKWRKICSDDALGDLLVR